MIELTNNHDVIKQIIGDSKLLKASMTDEDLISFEAGTWVLEDRCQYLNYEDKAIVRVYPVTNLTVEIHPQLRSEFWGTGESHKLEEEIEQWLISNTNYCKVILQTPQCCREVLQAAVREGYALEGILTAAISWRNQIENIVVMSKFLKRN